MSFQTDGRDRRGFLQRALAFAGLSAAAPQGTAAQTPTGRMAADPFLPRYARVQNYQSLKQSSHDTTGGNRDFWSVGPGETKEIFNSAQPGAITHIWFTIAAQGPMHLKEIVLRAYWDGSSKPSVETPIGDFFGLNLGQYQIYESAYLACSPGKSLNSYFVMPYKKSARMTVTNEGTRPVGSFYSSIDYQNASVPDDAMYFHAQYRQATPNVPTTGEEAKLNPTGKRNY